MQNLKGTPWWDPVQKSNCRGSTPVQALAVKVWWVLCSDLFKLHDPTLEQCPPPSGESRAGQCPVFQASQAKCIPAEAVYPRLLSAQAGSGTVALWCWLTRFSVALYLFFSWYTQFMCWMQVVYSKDKGLQSLNQKWCWCNYKHRLVLQRGL